MNPIKIGTKISWVSAAGTLRGVVDSIKIDKNAADQMIPWITVRDVENLTENRLYRSDYKLQLCGNDGYMKMMKFAVGV